MSKSTMKCNVTVKHAVNGKTKLVQMPGGLLEADALQGAALKAGGYWRTLRAVRVDKVTETAMSRNIDLCCRSA